MKKLRYPLFVVIMICAMFVGIGTNKVSAWYVPSYKCVYKGGLFDVPGAFSDLSGKLIVNITPGSTVTADPSQLSGTKDDGNPLHFLSCEVGDCIGFATTAIEFMGRPDIERPLNYDTESYWEEIDGKCPATVNLFFVYTGGWLAFNNRNVLFSFDPDIWDWFEYDKGSERRIYIPRSAGIDYATNYYYNEDHTNESSTVWSLVKNESEKNKKTTHFLCKTFSEYWSGDSGLSKTYSSYVDKCQINSDTSECSVYRVKYENKLNPLKQWCNSVVSTRNYNSSCVNNCITLNKKLKKLYKAINPSNCNLSDNIVSFIHNILKWMKYIAPVLVIILGILDFIKALAAQDDDAMKKAQGKFVKRLIAAALLFLLPLIIDYVLRVFGLVNSKCDITKIF